MFLTINHFSKCLTYELPVLGGQAQTRPPAHTHGSAGHSAEGTLDVCLLNGRIGANEVKGWRDPGSRPDRSPHPPRHTPPEIVFSLRVSERPSEGRRLEHHLTPCYSPGCPKF